MSNTFELKDIIVPNSLFQTVKSMRNYKKVNVKIEPQGTNSNLKAGGTMEYALPIGAPIDLASFAVYHKGHTMTGTNATLPAFGDALYSILQVDLSGQTIQTINDYNVYMANMRNLRESPVHGALCATYNGMQNPLVTNDANLENIVSNWGGFLGCRKIIDASERAGINSFRVRITLAPNTVLAADAGQSPTYTINQVFATVNTIAFSDPDIEKAIFALNEGLPEIAFDNIQHYAQQFSPGTVNLRLPTNMKYLRKILVTSRLNSYTTIAPIGNSGRVYDSSSYFTFDGSNLTNMSINTGTMGNFPSQPLANPCEMSYFTNQSLDIDDNWTAGGLNCVSSVNSISGVTGTTGGAALVDGEVPAKSALTAYSEHGFGVVFGFDHRDAPDGMIMGYDTRGISEWVLNATLATDTIQMDAFVIGSAILTLKPGMVAVSA